MTAKSGFAAYAIDPERDRLGMETLTSAAEFVLAAQARFLALNELDNIQDSAAFCHYDLALQAMGSVALSLIPPGNDSHLGRNCDRLSSLLSSTPNDRQGHDAIKDARRAIFGKMAVDQVRARRAEREI